MDRWADNEGFQDIQHREIMKELYVVDAYQGACPRQCPEEQNILYASSQRQGFLNKSRDGNSAKWIRCKYMCA